MKFKLFICLLLTGALLVACAGTSTTTTPEPTNEPVTAEPTLPPTEAPAYPVFSNGVDTWYWQLKLVDLVESYTTPQGTYTARQDQYLLIVEFEGVGVPQDDLFKMMGLRSYHVTDSEGNEYTAGNSTSVGTNVVNIFQVPKDSHGFVFYFLDWPPFDLGK